MKKKSFIVTIFFAIVVVLCITIPKLKKEPELTKSTLKKQYMKELGTTAEELQKYYEHQEKCDFKIITLGEYEQDNDKSNGKEPIEWLVLYEDNEKMLVLSRYILDAISFRSEINAPWSQTTGYRWLNDDFYNSAFTEKERERIILTHHDEEFSAVGESDTREAVDEYIFYLSVDEIEKYMFKGGSFNNECLKGFIGFVTPYCNDGSWMERGLSKSKKEAIEGLELKRNAWWMTRTLGPHSFGSVSDKEVDYGYTYVSVAGYGFGRTNGFSNHENQYINVNGLGSYLNSLWFQRPAMYIYK